MAENRYKAKSLNRYTGKSTDARPEEQKRFQTFEDLEAYQVSREFRKAMYAVSRRLPDFEKFELASQIRRAAVSLTNNLAEGHGRYHYPDRIKFLLQSRGSLEELMDDLNTCLDEKYLPTNEIEALKQLGWRTLNVINGYGRYLRNKKAAQGLTLREEPPMIGSDANEDPFTDVTI